MFRSPRLDVFAILFSLLISSIEGMTYENALEMSKNNEADEYQSSVLFAFRHEHQLAEQSGDPIRLRNIKVNLASLLLLFANKEADPDVYMPMYKECSKLSEQALKLDVSSVS